MKLILMILGACLSYTEASLCYQKVLQSCGGFYATDVKCDAKYSGFHTVNQHLNELSHHNLLRSFQYLLMSTNFGNYLKNREGFSKLYRKLSDKTWEDTIDLIKYMSKRGGKASLVKLDYIEDFITSGTYEMNELASLARALDMHKALANSVHSIHSEVGKKAEGFHDAEVSSYLEEKFTHDHAEVIRDLSGHMNDLSSLIGHESDSSLSIFLFDQYLQKTV